VAQTKLVGLKELSEMLGAPVSTLGLMAREGRLPGAVRLGHEWLVDPKLAKKVKFAGRGRPAVQLSKKRRTK
jgi:hypothetical protein